MSAELGTDKDQTEPNWAQRDRKIGQQSSVLFDKKSYFCLWLSIYDTDIWDATKDALSDDTIGFSVYPTLKLTLSPCCACHVIEH